MEHRPAGNPQQVGNGPQNYPLIVTDDCTCGNPECFWSAAVYRMDMHSQAETTEPKVSVFRT